MFWRHAVVIICDNVNNCEVLYTLAFWTVAKLSRVGHGTGVGHMSRFVHRPDYCWSTWIQGQQHKFMHVLPLEFFASTSKTIKSNRASGSLLQPWPRAPVCAPSCRWPIDESGPGGVQACRARTNRERLTPVRTQQDVSVYLVPPLTVYGE